LRHTASQFCSWQAGYDELAMINRH